MTSSGVDPSCLLALGNPGQVDLLPLVLLLLLLHGLSQANGSALHVAAASVLHCRQHGFDDSAYPVITDLLIDAGAKVNDTGNVSSAAFT